MRDAAPAAREAPLAEFTAKAVVTGIVLGIVFGAANAYLGLRVGMTVSASIPAAVMTVAIFRLLGRKGTILEANLSQTIGSASTALATGSIYTLPALFLWGMAPPYLQVVALCFLGGVLGLAAMIPLRRLLIVQAADELPYPEGTACAEVLRATAADASGSAWIFRGMVVGAAIKIAVSLAFLFPSSIHTPLPSHAAPRRTPCPRGRAVRRPPARSAAGAAGSWPRDPAHRPGNTARPPAGTAAPCPTGTAPAA